MHHEDSVTTFLAGSVATWTGLVEGEEVEEEQVKLGACYKAPLNAQVTGGEVEWQGPGLWSPASVCLDWRSSNMAWVCQPVMLTPNLWSLQNCEDVRPTQKCSNYYNIGPAPL